MAPLVAASSVAISTRRANHPKPVKAFCGKYSSWRLTQNTAIFYRAANQLFANSFPPAAKPKRWNSGTSQATKPLIRIKAAIRICGMKPYVRHVTGAPIEDKSLSCQGLHNATFLSYGFWQVERSACLIASKRLELKRFANVAALPGG
jgi:hypothetical protein